MTNFKPLEYKKGFRLNNGRLVYGVLAMMFYTIGYVRFHLFK